jgi:hypothetical protein
MNITKIAMHIIFLLVVLVTICMPSLAENLEHQNNILEELKFLHAIRHKRLNPQPEPPGFKPQPEPPGHIK